MTSPPPRSRAPWYPGHSVQPAVQDTAGEAPLEAAESTYIISLNADGTCVCGQHLSEKPNIYAVFDGFSATDKELVTFSECFPESARKNIVRLTKDVCEIIGAVWRGVKLKELEISSMRTSCKASGDSAPRYEYQFYKSNWAGFEEFYPSPCTMTLQFFGMSDEEKEKNPKLKFTQIGLPPDKLSILMNRCKCIKRSLQTETSESSHADIHTSVTNGE